VKSESIGLIFLVLVGSIVFCFWIKFYGSKL